jgi:uncharacterized protein YukE
MSDCSSVAGNSSGMRELASALRQAATTAASCDAAVWPKARDLSFTGPAATRLQATLLDWHRDTTAAANALVDAAEILLRAAAEVDAERARLARLSRR